MATNIDGIEKLEADLHEVNKGIHHLEVAKTRELTKDIR